MKSVILMLLILFFAFDISVCLAGETALEEIGFGSVENLAESLGNSKIDVRKIALKLMEGEVDLPHGFVEKTAEKVLQTIKTAILATAKRLAVPLLTSLLLHALLGEKSSNNGAVQMLCRISCMLILINIYLESRKEAKDLIDLTIRISNILSPVMISAVMLTGAETSASILSPLAAMAAEIMNEFFGKFGIGLSGCAIGIAAADCISERFRIKKLFKLIKGSLVWSVGIMMAVFIGILSIQGLLGASHDSAAVRGVRYAVESTVPIIGGEVSDTMDSMLSSVLLLKNAVGVTGLILLLSACFAPVLKIAAMMISIKIAAAIAEPVSDGCLIKGISCVGETFEMLLASCIGCVMLAILLIGAFLIAAGNVVR